MTLQRQHWQAFGLGVALLVTLLLLSSLVSVHELPAKPQVMLQNVEIYHKPKPPPAPEQTMRSKSGGGAGDLQVKIPQRQVELGLMKLQTNAAMVAVPAGYSGGGGLGKGIGSGIGDGVGEGGLNQLFGLNQLDSTPMVISAPPLIYPDSFRRKNILQFRVVFHIVVDEGGGVHPVRVLESPDHTLDPQFLDYAAHVTFTPPVRGSKKVKAEYSWPVLFQYNGGR